MSAARDDQERHDQLSALLDGELSRDEAAAVEAYLANSPEARAVLDDLTRVRALVRDLPDVDPPFGFYERMLSPRRTRRFGPKAAAAFVAAAAAIIVLVGLTPVADSVVPPVNAYAERHMHMITPVVPDRSGATAPAGAAGSSTTIAAPKPGSALPPVTPAQVGSGDAFGVVDAGALERMGAPAQIAGSYQRMAGYQSEAGVLHLMYSNGTVEISIYEQSGTVAWESLPTSGTKMQLGEHEAWAMTSEREEVMVVERDTTVYTVVAVGGHDEMVDVMEALPPPPPPSMIDRARQACRSVVEHFGFDQ